METFKIVLELTEPEFLAVARLGDRNLRSPRNQAHYLLRSQLVTLGEFNPAPVMDEVTADNLISKGELS